MKEIHFSKDNIRNVLGDLRKDAELLNIRISPEGYDLDIYELRGDCILPSVQENKLFPKEIKKFLNSNLPFALISRDSAGYILRFIINPETDYSDRPADREAINFTIKGIEEIVSKYY